MGVIFSNHYINIVKKFHIKYHTGYMMTEKYVRKKTESVQFRQVKPLLLSIYPHVVHLQ